MFAALWAKLVENKLCFELFIAFCLVVYRTTDFALERNTSFL
jgi:hypothetical protein